MLRLLYIHRLSRLLNTNILLHEIKIVQQYLELCDNNPTERKRARLRTESQIFVVIKTYRCNYV